MAEMGEGRQTLTVEEATEMLDEWSDSREVDLPPDVVDTLARALARALVRACQVDADNRRTFGVVSD